MTTVAETLQSAIRLLQSHSESPRLDAELLLGKVLGMPRSSLLAHGEQTVPAQSALSYSGLVEQRRGGAPVAYLTGSREFWSLPLHVSPAVLVPRPETETLVELALEHLPAGEVRSVLDLGTGSGAIALAIASERPQARITAVDISQSALRVAKRNSEDLALTKIEWRLGSWFEPVRGERFDVIVANPPYIAGNDPALQKLRAEPAIALSNGPSGLEALAAIAAEAPAYLQAGGWLLFEHGSEQAPQVAGLLERRGFTQIRSHPDISGRPRVTLGTIHSTLGEHS